MERSVSIKQRMRRRFGATHLSLISRSTRSFLWLILLSFDPTRRPIRRKSRSGEDVAALAAFRERRGVVPSSSTVILAQCLRAGGTRDCALEG